MAEYGLKTGRFSELPTGADARQIAPYGEGMRQKCAKISWCSKNNEREFLKPLFLLVPGEGIEPTRDYSHQILSLARLPVPPSRQVR